MNKLFDAHQCWTRLKEHFLSSSASQKHTTQGRSMIEMLGVIAIVGVISIIALFGYSYAMNKHKANLILNDVSLAFAELVLKDENIAPIERQSVSFKPESGLPVQIARTDAYWDLVYVENVPQKVCQILLQYRTTDIYDNIYDEDLNELTSCDDPQTMVFGRHEPLPECADDSDCEGDKVCRGGICVNPTPTDPCDPNPCLNGGTCSEGECTCIDGYYGAKCENEPECRADTECDSPKTCQEYECVCPKKDYCLTQDDECNCTKCEEGYVVEGGACVKEGCPETQQSCTVGADSWCCEANQTCGTTAGECCGTANGSSTPTCCAAGALYPVYADGETVYQYGCCEGPVFKNFKGETKCCWDSDKQNAYEYSETITKGKVVDVFKSGTDGSIGQTCCTYYTQQINYGESGITYTDINYTPEAALWTSNYGYESATCCNGRIYKEENGNYGCCGDPNYPNRVVKLGTSDGICCADGQTAARSSSQYQSDGCCTDGRVSMTAPPDPWGTVQSYCCNPDEKPFDGVFTNVRSYLDRQSGCCPADMEVMYPTNLDSQFQYSAYFVILSQEQNTKGTGKCCVKGTTYAQCCQPGSKLTYNALGDFQSCCADGEVAYCTSFDMNEKCLSYTCSSTACRPYCARYDWYTGKCMEGACETNLTCEFGTVWAQTGCCEAGTTPYCKGPSWGTKDGVSVRGSCYHGIGCCEGEVYFSNEDETGDQYCCSKDRQIRIVDQPIGYDSTIGACSKTTYKRKLCCTSDPYYNSNYCSWGCD